MSLINPDLKLILLGVNHSHFDFFPPKNSELRFNELLEAIDPNIEFDVGKSKDVNRFLITLKVSGCADNEEYIGYKFSIESFMIFELININDESLVENYVLQSALPMLIGHTRAIISQITANMPLREYCLPSIDVSKLISIHAVKETN